MTTQALDSTRGLSQREIERFWEEGFVVFDDLFTADEVEEWRAACESPEIALRVKEDGGDDHTVHLLELAVRHKAMLALARHAEIVRRIAPLIGENIELQHSKLATQPKAQGKGGFGWHQDFAFFPHTNTDLVAVMVMLDDATPENGCMSMVKSSHRLGLLDHTRDGYFTSQCQESRVWEDDPTRVVRVTPRAGGISIHHCLTVHGSGPNICGRPRRGIVFQYRAADAYQLADNVWEDTGLLISGTKSETVRCVESSFLLPRFGNKPAENPYGNAWNQRGRKAYDLNKATS